MPHSDMAHSDADPHSHVFLGDSHERNERRTWMVIALCTVMMAAEIAGGLLFGSIALVADGLHMSTHASALLLAALAYNYARRHAGDSRFSFGTGKLGDLAGFTSAVILALISLLIAYEAVTRLIWPFRFISAKRSRSPSSASSSTSPACCCSAAAAVTIMDTGIVTGTATATARTIRRTRSRPAPEP